MIGVVVWSNKESEKAVVWCEDHGSLAYLGGSDSLTDPTIWPEPGDLLELESEMVGELRYARRVSLLTERGFPQLPEILRKTGDAADSEAQHLRLVSSQDYAAGETGDASCDVAIACVGGVR
ncbi:hypothetical protein [Paracoccus sp. (in: a-proteobacteria)]|uniref:hypothetical protein n=1 Tax=Paracoccus sp. TaxID=267 RepID=UPI003A85D429